MSNRIDNEFSIKDINEKIPSLKKIRKKFRTITQVEFNKYIDQLMETQNEEDLQTFFYYIILFRDFEIIQKCLNSKTVPVEFIEKLFIFTFGHCSKHGYCTESMLDNMLFFLSDERLLNLILKSEIIRNDKLLMFNILTRLDLDSINEFFKSRENLVDIISAFYRLPEKVMKSIIARNHNLFVYIMMMVLVDSTLGVEAKIFIEKYKDIIDQFSSMSDVIRKYHATVNIQDEEKLPFDKRDMSRISFLVKTLRSMPDRDKALEFFSERNVFVDDHEQKIVTALLCDPLLKNVFEETNIQKFQ